MRGAHSGDAKIKATKISSKGLTSNSAKICTSENFPLYGSMVTDIRTDERYIDAQNDYTVTLN